MKSTGVIRRIDDLGRIVIPKEIRKNLKIREGDTLEIYVSGDEIVLKKFSLMSNLLVTAGKIADVVSREWKKNILITNTDRVIACSKSLEKQYLNQEVDSMIRDIMQQRTDYVEKESSIVFFITEEQETCFYMISPIIVDSDVVGSVILFDEKEILDSDYTMVKMLSSFLEKNIDE